MQVCDHTDVAAAVVGYTFLAEGFGECPDLAKCGDSVVYHAFRLQHVIDVLTDHACEFVQTDIVLSAGDGE